MNISQLRETVTLLLSSSPNLVGQYTLPNGQIIPAIYTVGRQGVPKEWKVSGMEVTIREYPQRPSTPMLGKVKIAQVWEVILVQYTPSSNAINEAMERIVRRFPDAVQRYYQGDDITYERCRFMIPDTIVSHLYLA